MLKPLGDVVDQWGARRVLALREGGVQLPTIAGQLGMSISTVERVLDHAAATEGGVRVPRQGQGKQDDPRWKFAGPSGPKNLVHLDRLKAEGGAEEELIEVHNRVSNEMDNAPAYSTMCKALRGKLDYTEKLVRAYPPPHGCARYHGARDVCPT